MRRFMVQYVRRGNERVCPRPAEGVAQLRFPVVLNPMLFRSHAIATAAGPHGPAAIRSAKGWASFLGRRVSNSDRSPTPSMVRWKGE